MMAKNNPEKTNEVVSLLERNNELLAVLVKAQLSEVLEKELADPKQRKLYELTGKNVPVKQIASKINSSPATISRTWQRWERLGVLIKEGKQYRRVFP